MITITDHNPTARPIQTEIAKFLAKAGAAIGLNSDTVIYTFDKMTLKLSGSDLAVDGGTITAGTITAIELADDLSPGGNAPFVYDPRLGSIDGLDLTAARFNALLDLLAQGSTGPMMKTLTRDGITYQDSYYDNAAKGGRGDDLFRDLSGSDSYNGGAGQDTLSYEFSNLSGAFGPLPLEGAEALMPTGIAADLKEGTVHSNGFPPPLFLGTPGAGPLPGYVETHTDLIKNIEHLTGSRFDDRIAGDALANTLRGLAGDDHIRGRRGDDHLDGGEGDDRLFGNRGNDTITSGDGRDMMTGGAGEDHFIFALSEDGHNVIRDFNPLEDEIDLHLLGFDLSIEQMGDDVVIRHADDPLPNPTPGTDPAEITVVLRDTDLSDLSMGENLTIFYAQYGL